MLQATKVLQYSLLVTGSIFCYYRVTPINSISCKCCKLKSKGSIAIKYYISYLVTEFSRDHTEDGQNIKSVFPIQVSAYIIYGESGSYIRILEETAVFVIRIAKARHSYLHNN